MGLQGFPSVLCFKGFWDPHSSFLRVQKSKSRVLNSEIFQLYPNGLANRQTDARLIMFYRIVYGYVAIQVHVPPYLAHRSRRLRRWAYSIARICRPSVVTRRRRPSTLSNKNISKTSWLILVKFYQLHLWGGGKAALSFGADWIQTVVTMATESSHWHVVGKAVSPHFLSHL